MSVEAVRYGIKGVAAAEWLVARGMEVPGRANAVARWPGGRCLRLGNTEFLVEHDAPAAGGTDAPAAIAPLVPPVSIVDGAWILIRSDHSVVLRGPAARDALSQGCSFDLDRLRDDPDQVVMTLFAGISVTLIHEDDAEFALRLWCDASFATYLHHCLDQLAAARPLGEQR